MKIQMEDFVDLKTKVYFLQHFLALDVDKWPEIAEIANLKEMDADKNDSFESWITAEFIPIYNKVRNYNKKTAEVNELKSKINEYEEKLAEYRKCFTDREMQPIEVKSFVENLDNLVNQEIPAQKLSVKTLTKEIDDIKRNIKSTNNDFDELVRLFENSDKKKPENIPLAKAEMHSEIDKKKFELKSFDETTENCLIEFCHPNQKFSNVQPLLCYIKKESDQNNLKNEYKIFQIKNGSSKMNDFIESNSNFYDAKMQLLILYDMWIKDIPLESEILILKEKFALDWNVDERRLIVLFANATCNLLVESLEKFEIESVKDTKSKKPIEIKKPRHCKSLLTLLEHLKEKLPSL